MLVYYQRSTKPFPEGRRLTRAEMKLYSICRKATSFEEIVSRTGFKKEEVNQTLDGLIADGLIYTTDDQANSGTDQQQPAIKTQTTAAEIIKPSLDDELIQLRQSLKLSLLSHLPPKDAQSWIDSIDNFQNINDLKEGAHKIALKIKLTVSKQAGQALLKLLT